MYKFSIEFYKKKRGYRVVDERLVAKCEFIELEEKKEGVREKEKIGEGEINLTRDNEGKVKYDLKPEDRPIKIDDIIPPFLSKKGFLEKLSHKELFIETPFFSPGYNF